jgi:hypothetical protein
MRVRPSGATSWSPGATSRVLGKGCANVSRRCGPLGAARANPPVPGELFGTASDRDVHHVSLGWLLARSHDDVRPRGQVDGEVPTPDPPIRWLLPNRAAMGRHQLTQRPGSDGMPCHWPARREPSGRSARTAPLVDRTGASGKTGSQVAGHTQPLQRHVHGGQGRAVLPALHRSTVLTGVKADRPRLRPRTLHLDPAALRRGQLSGRTAAPWSSRPRQASGNPGSTSWMSVE